MLNSTSFIPPSFALKHYQQFDGGTGAAGSCLRTDDRFIIDNQGAPDDYPLTPNDCFSACTSADAATTHCTPLQCLERHLAIRNYAEANGINRDGMTSQQIANATAGVTCVPTTVATRLECYCIQSLLTALQTDGALLGPFALMDSTVCTSFAENSLIGAGMRILATLSVVSMSGLLRLIWSHVVHFERHDSEGSLSIALAWKLFIGVFVNNSVVILVTVSPWLHTLPATPLSLSGCAAVTSSVYEASVHGTAAFGDFTVWRPVCPCTTGLVPRGWAFHHHNRHH